MYENYERHNQVILLQKNKTKRLNKIRIVMTKSFL